MSKRSIVRGGTDTLLLDVLIGLWRIDAAVDKSAVGQRVADISSRLETKFGQAGYVVQDKTGQFYDPGMPLKVLTSIPKPGLSRPTILETISPTLLLNGKILKAGEVVVGVPAKEGATLDE
ncbi:MAG: hypothetical protein GXP16_12355 [Gammaproteobacteria bacterium]|nr:hypothetical protein [Gammaproteobacteria bacterium]